jgi:DNA-binding winged helix-turn-helix (wHTH) protein/tetratricopeptide (TPR) repeat protein
MTEENQTKTERYCFGDCVLDADRRELTRAGETVTTQPKAFEMLLYLVRNRHRAVEKDELQDVLWPRSIVTETALTRCVMKARRAVGDEADKQAIIKTVHGHGYRFVAAIEDDAEPAAEPAPEPVVEVPAAEPRRKRGGRSFLYAASAVLAAFAAGWWLLSSPAVSGEVRIAVLPMANETGDAELDWIRTGMMSLTNRMLEAKGVPVVAESRVRELAGDASLEQLTGKNSTFLDALHQTTGHTHTLSATLRYEQGLYRLVYTFAGGGGRPLSRTIVGKEPARLVKDAVDTIASLVTTGPPPDEHIRVISDDDFLNEAYARAMSLQFEGNYEDAMQLFAVIIEQDPELFWPRYEYALCVRNLHDYENAERLITALVEEQRESGNEVLQAISTNGLGILYMNQRRNDEALGAFESVLDLAARNDKQNYVVTANVNLALLKRNMGNIQGALAHMQAAHEALQQQDLASYPGTFHNSYAGILMRTGDLGAAEKHSLAAIENFRLTGRRLYAAYAQSRLSSIYRALGRYDEARELAEQSLVVRREFKDERGVSSSLMNLAGLSVELGDITRSRQYAEQVYDIGVQTDEQDIIAGALQQIALADRLTGQPRAAADGYREAEAMHSSINNPISATNARIGLARCWIDMREFDAAESIAREILQSARDDDRGRLEARTLILLGEIHLARQSWDQAIRSFDEALAIASRLGDGSVAFSARVNLARAWLEFGDTDAAQPFLDAIVAERPEQTDVRKLRARMAWERGDASAAAEFMALARSGAGEVWSDDDETNLERYRSSR